jgi:hypothetical protein
MEDKTYKFVKQDEISSLLDSIIKKENKDYRYEYPVSVFDPSHVTECPRRMIYRANGCMTENSISYPSIYNDLFAKKKWMEYFSKCKPIKIVDKNIVAADCHYNVSGNVDAILNMGDCLYVAKIQPVGQEDFSQINKKGAFKKHVVEVIVYIWLTELRDGLLLYENKNNNDYTIFHVKLYEPIIKSVTKKCLELMENKIQGIIPARPYKTKESNECMSCEFLKRCWEDKKVNA